MVLSLSLFFSDCFLLGGKRNFHCSCCLLRFIALVFIFVFFLLFYICFATFRMTRKRSLHLMTTPKGGKNAQPNELVPKNSLKAPPGDEYKEGEGEHGNEAEKES